MLDLWGRATCQATSSVAFAEIAAALHRKRRIGGISPKVLRKVLMAFERDWQTIIRVHITDDLNVLVTRLVKHHPLRGFDAIHLASALLMRERSSEPVRFACFDHRLWSAAKAERFECHPRQMDQS